MSKNSVCAPRCMLVDAHVHIYKCFDLLQVLESARRNFHNAAERMLNNASVTGVLMLTETGDNHWFDYLATVGTLENWIIEQTSDPVMLRARPVEPNPVESIYIFAGRQIVTAEGLELLALATGGNVGDGMRIREAIEQVREQSGMPVIPWAAGKWLGRRGRLLAELQQQYAGSDLCLGDNGGRPVLWRTPSHFRFAEQLRMPVLPGSDPLPLPGEEKRVGSFGSCLRLDRDDIPLSGQIIKSLFFNEGSSCKPYGELLSPFDFVVNQIRLRMM